MRKHDYVGNESNLTSSGRVFRTFDCLCGQSFTGFDNKAREMMEKHLDAEDKLRVIQSKIDQSWPYAEERMQELAAERDLDEKTRPQIDKIFKHYERGLVTPTELRDYLIEVIEEAYGA